MDGPPPLLLLLCLLHFSHNRNLFTQRMCCKRQSHFVYIGQDISGSPVSVDVGVCRSHCGRTRTGPSPEAGQEDYSKHTSMLEFLRSKKTRMRRPAAPSGLEPPNQLPSCGASQVCEPAGMRVERVLLFEGPRQVEVIQECQCEIKLTQCMRVPALRTYYAKTPYETVIDAGGCSRSKGPPEGFSCVPTKFDSALIQTPNKVELIQTVLACELKESCSRVKHVDYYYQTVQHADGVAEKRLKEIDVGRCVGSCTAGKRCLLRSPTNPEICYLWSEGQSSSCVPQDYESHSFQDQQGQTRTVLSITSCSCQS
uniref:Im:7138239 n=1 Tax=Salarias fasciatus TaxID=181472 RepID=A0A672HGT6_SALFA